LVLKIEEASIDTQTVLSLAGRIESSDVQRLKAEIEGLEGPIAFDLDQVRLVNLDAVRFLAVCEKRGIELRNCPPHVRAWVSLEKARVGELE